MKCPACGHKETKVVDSRISGENAAIRRRRECLKCEKRFTTYEYIEQTPLMVVKKDGRRQAFDRGKLLAGLMKACEKRPISVKRMEALVEEIEQTAQRKFDREVQSQVLGEVIMEKLADLDEVAYVRFASVYRQFRDVNHFMKELQVILQKDKDVARRK